MNQELTSLSVLSLFNTTKDQRSTFVRDLVDRLHEGEANALQVHLYVKSMEDIINQLTNTDEKKNKNFQYAKAYKDYLLSESQKMGGKSFQYHNATFEIKEAGAKWDYSECNDDEIIELNKELESLKERIKARESFLQNIPPKGTEIIDDETGEAKRIYPPSKTSSTIVSVKLK